MTVTLTKSEYLQYLKHPAWPWLKKHEPDLLPPEDETMQALFAAGNAFEAYAQQLFPDAAVLGFENYEGYRELPERTREALAAGAPAIAQGRFAVDGFTCIVDVLECSQDGSYHLYEIKASTKVKDEHLDDLAFQTIVLERAGFRVASITVIHVASSYVRAGEIDPSALTKQRDVTADVRARTHTTEAAMHDALSVVRQPQRPDLSPRYASNRGFREWLTVYRHIYPAADSAAYRIYEMPGISAALIGQLEDRAVHDVAALDSTTKLTDKQQRFMNLVHGNAPVIDRDAIRSFLASFTYPLYFLDFETLGEVIPPFDGLRPYQQLPFQYSLHILYEDGTLTHRDYLHEESSMPTTPLAEQLAADVSTDGTVLAWNAQFEKRCNELLAAFEPECSQALMRANERVVDLMTPFAKGWYLDPRLYGSASIKAVLPVLAPDLTYDDLSISAGDQAQRVWKQVVIDGEMQERRAQVLDDLRAYCALDTYAMVRILQALQSL
jgi:hypothetical protein